MHTLKSPLILLLVGGFALLSSLSLAAEHKQPSIKPTFARDAVARVSRGGEVEITLDAIPSYGNAITFQIQNPPIHGTLSGLHGTSDHTASVTYHHDGSKSPLADTFTFRAQATGQSVSETCLGTITIVPPRASLVFDPPSLDFGELTLPEKRQTKVTIINRGGTIAEGRLVLPKGFSAPLAERYRLGEGESNIVAIEFDPMEEREYRGPVVTLPSCEIMPLELHGVGVARFEVTKHSPSEWRIKNLTDTPLKISYTGGEGWILPKETTLPPNDSRIVAFQQAEAEEGGGGATNPVSSNSVVHLSDGLSDRDLELPPPTRFLPTVVQAVTPSALGNVPIGATVQIAWTIINRSEFPKHLTWQLVSPSGGGSDAAVPLDLKGGESREISYGWKPALPGDATITATVSEGRSTHQELIWKARVMTGTGADTSLTFDTNHAATNGEQSENEQPQVSSAPSAAPANFKPIPSVDGIGYEVKAPCWGGAWVVLKWNGNEADLSRFKIEEQQLVFLGPLNINKETFQPPKTKLVVTPVDTSTAKQEDDHLQLKLQALPPGWHHLVLSQFSKEGLLEAQTQFQIRMPAKLSLWERMKIPVGILVISFLLFYLRKIRRG